MSSLAYLWLHSAKNKALLLLQNPLRLIMYIGFVLLTFLNFFAEKFSVGGSRPIDEFYAIIFLFYIFCFVSQLDKGFSHGGTMFNLTDISFLFVSPLKPTSVLFYAMVSRLGSSMWMGLVFIYQFTLLRSFYPIGITQMLIAVVGYGILIFISQTAGMLVYFLSCGEKKRIKRIKSVLFLIGIIFVLLLVFGCDFSNLTVSTLAKSFTRPIMRLFPVAGWILSAVVGIYEGDMLSVAFGIVACGVFVAGVFALLSFSKHGYYEDVLLTAEKKVDENGIDELKTKALNEPLTDTLKGQGASAIYYKHRIENRRTKSTLFDQSSLLYLVLLALYGFVFKSGIISLLALSFTVSGVTVISGRWTKELSMPYVYMIPAGSTRKLFFMLPEMLPRVLFDSLTHSLLISFICKSSLMLTFAVFLSRTAFCFVLMGASFVTARAFREKEKNNVFAAVSILVGLVASLPSIMIAAVLVFHSMGLTVSLLVMSACNLAVGFVLLLFARKLLDYI